VLLIQLASDTSIFIACSAGVFFGRANVFARENAMLKLQKRGENKAKHV